MADEFLAQSADFNARVSTLGLPDVSRFYWYHTIELGSGLITPGLYDYRSTVNAFGFPEDMSGMHVLDVGSATGFFAFEFERRGARVVSLELPSLTHLDRFPGQSLDNVLAKIERMIYPDDQTSLRSLRRGDTAGELYYALLEGPFRFCANRLNSRVERCYSSLYDLTADKLPRSNFDVVFIGDVLVHTLYPLRALASIAPLCAGTLVLAQDMSGSVDDEPVMKYTGGDSPAEDHVSWWEPNKACFVQMLRKLGFASVQEHGSHTGILRPGGYPFHRPILHARKG